MSIFAVILGASKFRIEGLESSEAFTAAKASFVDYLTHPSGLNIPDDAILDLFDSQRAATSQLAAVQDFILEQNAKSPDGNTTVIFYYVGHGYIRKNTTDLHWAVASTTKSTQYPGSIAYRDLFEGLKAVGSNMRIIGVIDCCYSGTARGAMAGDEEAQSSMEEVFVGSPFSGGYALLCAAGSKERTYILEDQSSTVFTSALMHVLTEGWGTQNRKVLTPHDLVGLARAHIASSQPLRGATPEVYDVGQENGVLSTVPFFPILAANKAKNEATSRWVASNDDVLRATRLHLAAIELLPEVAACLRATTIHTDSYAYVHRAKTIDRILDKVGRRIDDDLVLDYKVDSVTDILGLRVISLFNEDLQSLTMAVLDIILGTAEYKPNPLEAEQLAQIRIYTTSPVDNPTTGANRLKKKIVERLEASKYSGLDVKIEPRADYSSIHMVIYVPPKPNGSSKSFGLVPVEIQIRTVFEDTWSRIDHVLRYSRSREKRTMDAKSVPVASERHLITLKTLLDACSTFAETIRDEISTQSNSPSFNLHSVDVRSDVERIARLIGVDPTVTEDIATLLREKDEIDEDRKKLERGKKDAFFFEGTAQQVAERYAMAAEKFTKKLRDLAQPGAYLAPDKLGGAPNQFVHYTLRMEEAYCRTLSNQRDELKQAQKIYRELSETYLEIPVLLLRLGQASAKLGDYDIAVKAYDRSLVSYQAKLGQQQDERDWQFTPEQKAYIAETIHRVYGFACWKKFVDLGKSSAEAIKWLRKAWDITAQGQAFAEDADGRLRLINNLLSYFGDMEKLQPRARKQFSDVLGDQKWLRDSFDALRASVDVKTDPRLQMLHTIVIIAKRLGEDRLAKSAARRAVSVALADGAVDRYARDVLDTALRDSWAVIDEEETHTD